MMSINIKINGFTIGRAEIKNEGPTRQEEAKDYRKYSIVYYKNGQKIIDTYITHKRSDGAEKLVELVFGKILEETKK